MAPGLLETEYRDKGEGNVKNKKWTPKNDDDFAVLAVRNLVLDMCMQNGGGHGGSALGMAAIGVALWKYVMRYDPCDPEWFDRDRFVLSNGHTSMFLYAMNHLVGYDAWTMEELKGYGNAKLGGYETIAHAHPEIEVPGIEVTTGPLGQGIANAVGLAIASKNLAATFNRPGHNVVQSRIYCMTGDGCLMEGVALEAISLAGHLKLDNLVLLYDNNQVTCDGPLQWINSAEDTNAKMRACGWHVLDVLDGTYDVHAIVGVLNEAKASEDKPVFINIRTIIGVDMASAGTAKAHHGGFDAESISTLKKLAGLSPSSRHEVPQRPLDYLRQSRVKGKEIHHSWNEAMVVYDQAFPKLGVEFASRREGFKGKFESILKKLDSKDFRGMPTRETNGLILEQLWAACPSICGGGADLVNSNKIVYAETDVFSPSAFKGRYIRNGIREHAMASIANGLAAYAPGTFLPITATFFMFYIYAAPGVRMGALSHLQVIHIATHDSFAEGQNGPTHQPVELDSLYRAMPNLKYMRPCDAEELIGAWTHALQSSNNPSMLSIARDPVGHVPNTSRVGFQRGAYVIKEAADAALTLVSCGSALHHVVAASKLLESQGIPCRIVSAPCLDIFDEQESDYREKIFPLNEKPIVSVEEYVATTWARYVTASIGMTSFGYSASNESNYARFGLDAEGIEKKVKRYLKLLAGRNARQAGWQELY